LRSPLDVAWAGVGVVNVAALVPSAPAGATGWADAIGTAAIGTTAGFAACATGRALNFTTTSL